jgi:hypothetical protein
MKPTRLLPGQYSKTAIRRLSRRATDNGYFDNQFVRSPGEPRLPWTQCPECRQRVDVEYSPSWGTPISVIRLAVAEHLRTDWEAHQAVSGADAPTREGNHDDRP